MSLNRGMLKCILVHPNVEVLQSHNKNKGGPYKLLQLIKGCLRARCGIICREVFHFGTIKSLHQLEGFVCAWGCVCVCFQGQTHIGEGLEVYRPTKHWLSLENGFQGKMWRNGKQRHSIFTLRASVLNHFFYKYMLLLY